MEQQDLIRKIIGEMDQKELVQRIVSEVMGKLAGQSQASKAGQGRRPPGPRQLPRAR